MFPVNSNKGSISFNDVRTHLHLRWEEVKKCKIYILKNIACLKSSRKCSKKKKTLCLTYVAISVS